MFNYIDTEIFNQLIPFFTTEYSRFLDRIELARLLSKHSINFGLFGKDWTSYTEFESFSSDHISSEKELFSIYKKTKINLYNNTHGLGMHSKTFEIMINGGFFALPKSKKNFLKGGINEHFNENEHFVTFSPEKFDNLIDVEQKTNLIPDISNLRTLSFSLVYLFNFIGKKSGILSITYKSN